MKSPQSARIKAQTSDKAQSSSPKLFFELEERMSKFGEGIINFCKKLQTDHISKPIISQLIRSSTSVGANYAEANNASSRADFKNKIYIAKKEAQESQHWLRMLKACFPEKETEISLLRQEAHELTLILQAITSKINSRV